MNYITGDVVKVGDKVALGQGDEGIIVCSLDTDEYSEEYPGEQWAYLRRGVLLKTKGMGLVHYTEIDEDLTLIERAPTG